MQEAGYKVRFRSATLSMRAALTALLFAAAVMADGGPEPVIHDAHIHYSEDVWQVLPPARAVAALRNAGIGRALVSATPAEGAAMLYRAAPDLVVPFLRPYKSVSHRYHWFDDPSTPAYVREHLGRAPYRGIGEFHIRGEQARTPVVAEVIAIARERGLALHAHTDAAGIEHFLAQAPDVPVIWAHGGFDAPLDLLERLLEAHGRLYIELSYREGMLDETGVVVPRWRSLLGRHRDRFLVGADTYTPGRWAELADIARDTRAWLAQLSDDVADAIARGNLDRLFPAGD